MEHTAEVPFRNCYALRDVPAGITRTSQSYSIRDENHTALEGWSLNRVSLFGAEGFLFQLVAPIATCYVQVVSSF